MRRSAAFFIKLVFGIDRADRMPYNGSSIWDADNPSYKSENKK